MEAVKRNKEQGKDSETRKVEFTLFYSAKAREQVWHTEFENVRVEVTYIQTFWRGKITKKKKEATSVYPLSIRVDRPELFRNVSLNFQTRFAKAVLSAFQRETKKDLTYAGSGAVGYTSADMITDTLARTPLTSSTSEPLL